MKKYTKIIFGILITLVLLAAIVHAKKTKTEQIQNGVWKVSYGTPEKFNLLKASNPTAKKDALDKLSKTDLPIAISDVKAQIRDGKTYLRFPLERDEQIYGLGLNFKKVNQRGTIRRLQMDIYHGRDDGRTHAPIPFFISSRGYGVLINSARKLDIYCGTTSLLNSPNAEEEQDRTTQSKTWKANPYSDNMEIIVPKEGVEVLFFSGKDLEEVVQRYNLFNGGGAMPARSGLGFWHRVPLPFSDAQVIEEVDDFIKRGYTIGVVGLEPGWHSNSYPCTYDWDKMRFPDPKKLIDQLNQRGVKTNLWMNGYVSKKSSIYNSLKKFFADHTVWCGALPDYSMPQVRKIFKDSFKKAHLDTGVHGFKLDENDGNDFWLYPDSTNFPSEISGEQFRQTHAVYMQRMIDELYTQNGKRTYSLVRGTNAGTNYQPFVLYSDYTNHKDIITATVNSSLIGVLWTPEACNAGSADEWTKRIQAVAWSPLAMLNAWSSKKKAWSFPEVADDVKATFQLRMRLVPYIYNAFAKYHEQGVPPVRAMLLEKSFTDLLSDKNAKLSQEYKNLANDVIDQWMFGDDILVAPMLGGQKTRKVLLPKGKWFDFYTGKYAGEAEVLSVDFEANNKKIPVYVRDGALVPLADADWKSKKLTVRHYGNAAGKILLYDDNGENLDYKNGKFTKLPIEVKIDKDGKKTGIAGDAKTLFNFDEISFEFMTK